MWKMEGKKEKVSIDQVREIIRCLALLNAQDIIANKDLEEKQLTALEIILGYSYDLAEKEERKNDRREK